jgi:hypothetical protein
LIENKDENPFDNPISPFNRHNLTALFHEVISLAAIARVQSGEKLKDTQQWLTVAHIITAPSIAEALDREPPSYRSNSKSPFKYRTGQVTQWIETWTSLSGQRMIMITNGKRGKKRQIHHIIPVRKMHEGMWFKWEESIQS